MSALSNEELLKTFQGAINSARSRGVVALTCGLDDLERVVLLGMLEFDRTASGSQVEGERP